MAEEPKEESTTKKVEEVACEEKKENPLKSLFKKKEKEIEEDTRTPGVRRLETFMKYFSYVFVTFCWALTVEVFCFGQDSIRMSYFGYIFWYVFVIGFLGACYGGRGHRRGVGWRGTLGSVLCTIMFFIIIYAGDRKSVV